MPGARRKSASRSMAPSARPSLAQASNSADQPGTLSREAVPVEVGQPVGQVARPDHQDALLPQRAQPRPDLQQPVRVVGGQAELQHRHIGVRVHHLERHPGAVVQAAHRMLVHALAVRQQRSDLRGQRAGVRRRVGHGVEARVEAPEVVDQRRAGGRRGQRQRGRLPVRADDQHCARLGQGLCPAEELVDPQRVVEQRRCAMAEVESGQRPVLLAPARLVAAGRRGGGEEVVEAPPCTGGWRRLITEAPR